MLEQTDLIFAFSGQNYKKEAVRISDKQNFPKKICLTVLFNIVTICIFIGVINIYASIYAHNINDHKIDG